MGLARPGCRSIRSQGQDLRPCRCHEHHGPPMYSLQSAASVDGHVCMETWRGCLAPEKLRRDLKVLADLSGWRLDSSTSTGVLLAAPVDPFLICRVR